MADENALKKILASAVSNMMSKNSRELTFTLDKMELKTPLSEKPLVLSGKLTIEFSSKKGKK